MRCWLRSPSARRPTKNAMRAMQKLDELSGCDLHSSVILGTVDDSVFKRLGINVTCEATYEDNNLYHK